MRQLGTSSWINAAREKIDIDAIVDEIDLAAAAQLLLDRGADQLRVEVRHHGVDRQAVLGRRLDHATYRGCPAATCAACAESAWRSW